MLWMYDKEKDNILRRQVSPKQVFFVDDYNTSYFEGDRNTIAEDAFSRLDGFHASLLGNLKKLSHDEDFQSGEVHATMLAFMVTLFFRIPKNTNAYNRLFNLTSFEFRNADGTLDMERMEKFKAEETLRKAFRTLLPFSLIEQMIKSNDLSTYSKLYSLPLDMLILSDNPVVYQSDTIRSEDLIGPAMLPISSRRLFVHDSHRQLGDSLSHCLAYNALAIDQSNRIVCASRKEALQASVKYWQGLTSKFPMSSWKPHILHLAAEQKARQYVWAPNS